MTNAAGEAGQDAHIDEDPERDRLDLDAGQVGRVDVAADRVDVPAERHPVGQQGVAERQEREQHQDPRHKGERKIEPGRECHRHTAHEQIAQVV